MEGLLRRELSCCSASSGTLKTREALQFEPIMSARLRREEAKAGDIRVSLMWNNRNDLDLHVTNMSSTAGNRILKRLYPEAELEGSTLAKLAVGNSLYENQGDGTFVEVTEKVGGFPGGWAFGGGFIDFDNDGWEDLYAPNGFISGKSMKDT